MTLKRRAAVYLFTVLVLAVYSGPAASAQHTTPKLQNNAGAEKEQQLICPSTMLSRRERPQPKQRRWRATSARRKKFVSQAAQIVIHGPSFRINRCNL